MFQWQWLEDSIARGVLPKDADQYNSLHERLIEGWKAIGQNRHLHLTGQIDNAEDLGTLNYLQDCAQQAGLQTSILSMDDIGRTRGGFVDAANAPIALMFKLYPWEWMMREQFGPSLPGAPTQFVEPPWKAILSNKGILPLLWAMFPGHPNLLPAYFEDDPKAAELGTSYASKPLYSREGANIELVVDGKSVDRDGGPYGAEGYVRQAMAPLPQFDGNYTVIGSWFAAGEPCGLSVREDTCADHQEHVALFAARHRRIAALRQWSLQRRACYCPKARVPPDPRTSSEPRHPARPENRRPRGVRADAVHARGRSRSFR